MELKLYVAKLSSIGKTPRNSHSVGKSAVRPSSLQLEFPQSYGVIMTKVVTNVTTL